VAKSSAVEHFGPMSDQQLAAAIRGFSDPRLEMTNGRTNRAPLRGIA
jgi:hypothetical protein